VRTSLPQLLIVGHADSDLVRRLRALALFSGFSGDFCWMSSLSALLPFSHPTAHSPSVGVHPGPLVVGCPRLFPPRDRIVVPRDLAHGSPWCHSYARCYCGVSLLCGVLAPLHPGPLRAHLYPTASRPPPPLLLPCRPLLLGFWGVEQTHPPEHCRSHSHQHCLFLSPRLRHLLRQVAQPAVNPPSVIFFFVLVLKLI
jgi:hypothetical protein